MAYITSSYSYYCFLNLTYHIIIVGFSTAWTIAHNGACRRCDKTCPTVYQPICATRNGINHTIVNECYLERVRCKDPKSSKFYQYIS